MQKHIQEHREKKIAAFDDLARGWVPEEYRWTDGHLRQFVYFMILDYLMTKGNMDEVKGLIGYLTSCLEKMEDHVRRASR
jgi:hypothetical protein